MDRRNFMMMFGGSFFQPDDSDPSYSDFDMSKFNTVQLAERVQAIHTAPINSPRSGLLTRFIKPVNTIHGDGLSKLAVVVGHTRSRPGAWGCGGINSNEWHFNTDLAKIITRIGSEKGVLVRTYWRDKGGRTGAYRNLKAWGADAVAELHFNSTFRPSDKARGSLTIGAGGNAKESHRFACMVQQRTMTLMGGDGRYDYGVSRQSYASSFKIPWILTEPAFGNNEKDATLLSEKREAAAASVIEGFVIFKNALG